MVTELAGYDPVVAIELANREMPHFFNPKNVLLAVSDERGWNSVELSASWALGTKGTVNGSDIIHSASLATSNDERAIFQRVWKGQVNVLFPYIEEERIKLLNEFDSSLRLPIETDHGTITDLFD